MNTFLYCRILNKAIFPELLEYTVQNSYNVLENFYISSTSTNYLYRYYYTTSQKLDYLDPLRFNMQLSDYKSRDQRSMVLEQ